MADNTEPTHKPQRYRKKPVEVEAMLYDGDPEQCQRIHDWMGYKHSPTGSCESGIVIKTLEGEMLASVGDYIIRGVRGEFYPCKPDIFDATHEAMPDKISQRHIDDLKLRLAAFASNCVAHGDMTPTAKRMLMRILGQRVNNADRFVDKVADVLHRHNCTDCYDGDILCGCHQQRFDPPDALERWAYHTAQAVIDAQQLTRRSSTNDTTKAMVNNTGLHHREMNPTPSP